MPNDSSAAPDVAQQLGSPEQAGTADAAASPLGGASLVSKALAGVALAGFGAVAFARSWTQGLRSHAEALEETRDEMADDCGDEADWYKKEPAQTAAQH